MELRETKLEQMVADPKNKALVKSIASRTRDPEDCEQEIWLKLVKASQPHAIDNEAAYVAGIALKVRSTYFRKESRRRPDFVDPAVIEMRFDPKSDLPLRKVLQDERLSLLNKQVVKLRNTELELLHVLSGEMKKGEYAKQHKITTRSVHRKSLALTRKLKKLVES